jgi:hypothetical protein
MAERVPAPTELAKTNWNSDGTTYPSTDPGSSKRATGFQPKDTPVPGPGEVIPANDHNWLWGLSMQVHTWIKQLIARQWSDVYEAMDSSSGVSTFDVFRVMPGHAADTIKQRGSQLFSVTGTATGGTSVINPCTDGTQIYYIGGTSQAYIVAASPLDGSEIYDTADIGVGLSTICSDGYFLYVQTVDSGYKGLYRMDRTDGTQDGATSGTPAYYGCDRLAANGYYCVGIEPTGTNGYVVFYSDIEGTIVEDGIVATGSANLAAVAIDSDQCYVGGTRNTYDVWAFTLSTRAYAWGGGVLGWTAPTSAAITVTGLAADGDRVYVASDRQSLSAGGAANLFCVDRRTGQTLWSFDVTTPGAISTLDLTGLAVDDQYLFAVDDQDDLHIIDITGPTPAQVAFVSNFGDPCCDGVSVIGNSDVTTQLKRVWVAESQRQFQSVRGDDVNRRPFFNAAIPVER